MASNAGPTPRRLGIAGSAVGAAILVLILLPGCGSSNEEPSQQRPDKGARLDAGRSSGKGSAKRLKLFDAHLHLVPQLSPAGLFSLVREAGIESIVILGPPSNAEQAVRSLQQENEDSVFPFAGAPMDRRTRQPVYDGRTPSYIERQLREGSSAVGELPLRHRSGGPRRATNRAADDPIALRIYDLAARYRVPVTVHVEHQYSRELERALGHNRRATIIWAHMGDADATLVRRMLRRHRNLYVDISSRNPFFDRGTPIEEQSVTGEGDRLKSEWKSLFEDFPDRVLFGTDINRGRYRQVDELVSYYRSMLGQLKRATAERIAHANIERLLDRAGK